MLLSIAYFTLTVFTLILLLRIGYNAINKSSDAAQNNFNKKLILTLSLLVWLLYSSIIGYSGILAAYELPPRFPIFLILPVFAFTGVFVYKNRNAVWLQNIKPSELVYFQSFRILVETLFIYSIGAGILHKNVTLEGYNYDMLVGISAPIIGYLVFQRKRINIKTVLYWNYIGLLVLASVIFVFTSTTYFPSIYGESENIMPLEFTQTPYVFVASFLMPAAVFIHFLSIIQIRQILKQNK